MLDIPPAPRGSSPLDRRGLSKSSLGPDEVRHQGPRDSIWAHENRRIRNGEDEDEKHCEHGHDVGGGDDGI